MLLTLVKNNLKLMLREKMTMLFLIILPILLIAVLSSAFSKVLNKNYKIEPFTVGYSLEKGSKIENSFQSFITGFKEAHITLLEMSKDKALKEFKDEKLTAYIELNDDKYTIYKKDGFDINTSIFENSISSAMYIYDGNKALMGYLMEKGLQVKSDSGNTVGYKNFVKVETLKVEPVPSSIVYYGITEIVYVIWFGMIAVSIVINNERRYGVNNRIELTNVGSLTLFFGKLIPAVLALSIQIGIAAVTSTILMDINWGTSPLLSIAIIFLEIIAATSIGLLISLIIKNQALVNVIIFISTFFFGFIGGSFQTYMYNFVGDNLAKVSPLYYINRTLVELSTKGYSDYTEKCILLLLVIAVVSIIIGATATAKGREAA